MILKKLILIILFILLSCFVISVPQIYINIAPDFYEGNNIEFKFRMVSYENELIKYAASVNCQDGPQTLLELKQVQLKQNKPFYDSYSFGILDQNFEPGTCTATVSIEEPYQFTESKDFEIKTRPSFDYHITLSKKTITQQQELEIDYDSSVENPTITSTLTFPDKTTQQLTLPTTIKAEQIGTYEIESTATKEGYKTQTVKEQFGVIEKSAEIQSGSVCNIDGVCSNEENAQNCPQDCKAKDKKLMKKVFTKGPILYTLLITIILIIFLLLGIYFKRKKNTIYKI